MRRVRFCVATSLDGFIAGPNGEYDWILMDPDIDFGALMGSFDVRFLGRKSYEATLSHGGPPLQGSQAFVFSRTLQQEDCKGVTLSDDPAGVVAALRQEPGKDIWLFGGGELFASMLDQGLVDSIELAVIPVLLGEGIPVMPHPAAGAKLKLVSHRIYPKTGTAWLEYVPA